MDFDPDKQDRPRRLAGLALVVLLHVLVVWSLTVGLGRQAVEWISKPIEVAIIDEVRPVAPTPPRPVPVAPPTKPLAPRVTEKPPPPVAAPPAPPVVAVPEVVLPAAAPTPVIQVTQERAPVVAPEVRPAPGQALPTASAPAVAAAVAPAVRASPRAEVAIVCPGYQDILQSALAGQWDRVGITGVVKVSIRVRGNQILEVMPLSGPREYHRAVQNAVRRMKCTIEGAEEQSVPLEVSFREP